MELISLLCLLTISGMISCEDKGVTAMTEKEDNDVILDCSFGSTNIKNEAFDWKKSDDKETTDVFFYSEGKPQPGPEFKGRVFHFPDQLQFGNASIKIKKAKTSDSGTYTCYHAAFPPEIRSSISLAVDPILKPRPWIEGAAPQPIVTVHKINHGMLLQCAVRGASPEPELEWWDSDGNILPADKPQVEPQPGNKFDVILDVTVTKTGDYRCVSTQKNINHQIYTEMHIVLSVPEKTSWGLITGLVVAVIAAVVFGVLYFRQCSGLHSGMGERLDTFIFHKYKPPVMESLHGQDSSLHPSDLLEKPQETREPKLEAEPDEALMTPMQKSIINPNKHCQPFFST